MGIAFKARLSPPVHAAIIQILIVGQRCVASRVA
jgi:hypothetical protein